MKFLIVCVILLTPCSISRASDTPSTSSPDVPKADLKSTEYAPTDQYETCSIEGWRILVHRDLCKKSPELWKKTQTELAHQLYMIHRKVPAPVVKQLQQVTIWVERDEPHHPCMAYHPDAEWLEKHGMNPQKAQCVEAANAVTFLEWTKYQPCMVLHELAHAYHDQFLKEGFANKRVLAAYRQNMEALHYGDVLHINGRQRMSYASTNQMEYFAEATEAYFGTNDFFPFVRSELKHHDPVMFELMETIWHRKMVE